MKLEEIRRLAEQIGFSHIGTVGEGALILYPEVRAMCNADRCRNYGRSWSCPPACGSLDALREKIGRYRTGILVQTTGQMSDAFDTEVIRDTEERHRKHFDTLARQARILFPECLPMSAGGCRRCRKCTYPLHPCRYPDKLFPSMEASGLWVSDVCVRSGMQYNYGENTITYTSCVLI